MFAKHANNWFLFAKKIPCNKLLVTLLCFYFFRFHPARFYFSVSTSHYTKILQQYGIQPFTTVQYPSYTTLTLHDTTLEIEKRE